MEEALSGYRGALLVVSHDEELAGRIGLTQRWRRGGGAARVRGMSAEAVTVTEVRVLEGPNLYFTRPAVKVSLECPGYLAADEERAARARAPPRAARCAARRAPDSDQRQRFVMRLVAHVVRLVAHGSGTTRLAVRTRTGSTRDQVVVAFPWRWRGRGVALGESLATALGPLVDGTQAGGRAGHPGRRRAGVGGRAGRAAGAGDAAHPRRVRDRHERQDHDHPAAGPHRDDRRARHRVELHRRRPRPGRAARGGRLLRTGRCPCRAGRSRGAAGHPGDRPRGPAAQGHGGVGQRRQRRHQRVRGPPRAAGDRHRGPAGRGQGDRHPGHQAGRLGRAQR